MRVPRGPLTYQLANSAGTISANPCNSCGENLEIKMLNQTSIPNTPPVGATPFSSLRLKQNFGETLGVKKILNTVPVGKPPRDRFFRTHTSPDWVYPVWTLETKTTGETYIVSEAVASLLDGLVRAVELYVVVDRQNNVFLIPVPFPGPNGVRNPWHESLLQAVMKARTVWLRLSANKELGGYDIFEATAKLPEPIWPDTTMDELLAIAFRGRIITTPDHPVVQEKLGGV